ITEAVEEAAPAEKFSFKKLADSIVNRFSKKEAAVEEALEKAVDPIEAAVDAMDEAVEEAVAPVEAASEEITETVEEAVEEAAPVEEASEEITEAVEEAIEEAAPVEEASEEITEAVEEAIEEAAAPVEEASEEITEAVEEVVEKDTAPLEAASEEITEAAVEEAVEEAAPAEAAAEESAETAAEGVEKAAAPLEAPEEKFSFKKLAEDFVKKFSHHSAESDTPEEADENSEEACAEKETEEGSSELSEEKVEAASEQADSEEVKEEPSSEMFRDGSGEKTLLEIPSLEPQGEADEGDGSGSQEEPEAAEEEEIEEEPAVTENSGENPGFVQKLEKYGAFLGSESELGIIAAEYNSDAEKKKCSANVFLNDVRDGYEKIQRVIMRSIAKRDCTTREYLADVKKCSADSLEFGFEHLLGKGYLRKYTLIPGGEYFTASPKLVKAMTLKEGSEFVGIKKRQAEKFENENLTAPQAAARIAFIKLYSESAKRLTAKGSGKIAEKVEFGRASFASFVQSADGLKDAELLFGAFWTDGGECEEMLKTLKDYMAECGPASRITVAGKDRDKAIALINALKETVDFSDTKIFAYNFSTGEYMDYARVSRD
nr:hypothetical protein [Lachnospiraceae bacterium]